jgi:hypothetical protein
MADTQQQHLLNSVELNQVLSDTNEDTPTAPEFRQPGSSDEFLTPLQEVVPRKTTHDGENSQSDGPKSPVSKLLFTNGSEHSELVVASVARLEDIPVTPTMRRCQPQAHPSPCARNLADDMKRNRDRFDEGYDSDGEIGPFSNVLQDEGPQIFDEDALPNNQPKPPEAANTGDTNENESCVVGHVPIDLRTMDAMGKKELTVELKKRGQAINGKKGDLYNRLQKALDAKVAVAKPTEFKKKAKIKKATPPDNLNGFAPGSYWLPLVPIEAPIDEPENPNFLKARAPTVPEDEAEVVKLKHDFSEKFDRPIFTGTHLSDKLETHENGKVIKDEKGQP